MLISSDSKTTFLAVSLAFTVLGAGSVFGCEATKAEYQALSVGISYVQAISIMGCEGEEMSRTSLAGAVTFMVMWDGYGKLGANMNAMFQNNRLISKSQFGLE